MIGFLFGMAAGAALSSADTPATKPNQGETVLYQAEGVVGRKVSPTDLGTCWTRMGSISARMKDCMDDPTQWDILRITITPGGTLVWGPHSQATLGGA